MLFSICCGAIFPVAGGGVIVDMASWLSGGWLMRDNSAMVAR